MRVCAAVVLLAATAGALAGGGSAAAAQAGTSNPASHLPTTIAAVGAWDAAIVHHAAALIGSRAQWNRIDTTECVRDAKTFSVRCALERASDDAMGRGAPQQAAAAKMATAPRADCRLITVHDHAEGSCGPFLDEATVFSIARAKAITTGAWRADATPSEVWFGRMVNSEDPVMVQARQLVNVVAPGKYRRARLVEFNDDTTVTFANLQTYFRTLEERVRALTNDQVASSADDVEIELYAGGAGVIRTYNGWYAISGFSAKDSSVRFQIDTASELAPNAYDREIIQRADALLSSDAVWNRADNRKCPADATTWSIYCALEKATRDVTGDFIIAGPRSRRCGCSSRSGRRIGTTTTG